MLLAFYGARSRETTSYSDPGESHPVSNLRLASGGPVVIIHAMITSPIIDDPTYSIVGLLIQHT